MAVRRRTADRASLARRARPTADQQAIRAILDCLGLPTRAPPIAGAVEWFEEPEPQPW